jgi:quercetin dioxygenase-like cupin family protein
MRHFQRIADGVDLAPLLAALAAHPELWGADELRVTYAEDSPHREVDDILVRFNAGRDPATLGDDLECIWQPAVSPLFLIRSLALDLMRRVGGERLGRVMLTRLAPGKQIHPHADVLGAYAHYYNRVHLVLQSSPGCVFHAGQESVWMRPGEAWLFDAHAVHSVVNNGADDRIHLIVDVRIP